MIKHLRILSTLKYDFPAGLVVFLVALPLCLGVALASGAPLFSGIIAGIVGGLVVASLSKSSLSVSGPAAGLTVIVFSAIEKLGSYEVFLLAVVLAGLLQVALGYLKAGVIGHYFPSSVIKGMLAAIGLILILKQIPHAFGYDVDAMGDENFFQPDGENTFSELLRTVEFVSWGATFICAVSLAVLILWEKPFLKQYTFFRTVPGALLVVVLGVVMNELYRQFYPAWVLSGDHLVMLPVAKSPGEFVGQFTLPDFTAFSNSQVYLVAATIAIVASIETLLSVEAADKLDPYKRNTSTNRELKAQGVGNLVSGLLGGLPVTAVIVRTSANINAGGKTKLSAITHGFLLLVSVILIPSLLNRIPLACLAAILLMVGYKLTKVSLFIGMYRLGWSQFLPFVVTVVAILSTDLLKGIVVGMAVSIFYILRNNYKTPYFFQREKHQEGEKICIVLSEEVTFLNKGSLLLTLDHLPANSIVVIDGSKSNHIDYDVLEIIHDFQQTARHKNIQLELINIQAVNGPVGH
ncbi:MAG: SulP family inorganic anion transporter [Ferruginibacter sp.]|nr:SulP family inorganic anion transporter [Cytophagales bacterium]